MTVDEVTAANVKPHSPGNSQPQLHHLRPAYEPINIVTTTFTILLVREGTGRRVSVRQRPDEAVQSRNADRCSVLSSLLSRNQLILLLDIGFLV